MTTGIAVFLILSIMAVFVACDASFSMVLKEAEIIPAIVPDGFSPSVLLSITYPNKKVDLGNFIAPSESVKAPQISFAASDPHSQYALLMVDPDAPSKETPTNAPFRHWVVVNIPSSGDLALADQLSTYIGPGPPVNSGYHRYIFLLYKQDSMNKAFQALPANHSLFDYRAFAQQNGFKLVSANFFMSANS
ncbi:hypothetical protein G6F57_000448 [Rhizopus arrhizus]|uniref:Phosphatidylethanolamine-binding protein n=1 Tax=Rhizopus oryzae TaxID=64495 RepID=A0A9P6XL36_RHIOR|nr:hypothetical protein G6F23_000390 [Rhizopus arrhizus]KAG1426933.1 hypothetical protein G6F58_001254 [Rhizopus delemar]KAG0770351.1 hypothetical protein G6F24_000297 [Rhizopus arrhizus]KAG0797802.1 hypothetical protein G6F21_000244 [Rhizopus arrhizus]KAG0802073.1 hypothetical protein G6F22_000615 [Rhizopus arrhizus]